MNKKNIKDLRIALTINFMAEIVGLVTLYLSNIHSIKILSINILSCIFAVTNIVGILLVLKLVKNKKNHSLIILASLVIDIFAIILSIFIKTKSIVPYFQVLSDLLKFLVIISICKNVKKVKKKKEVNKIKICFLTTIISYIIAKVSYIVLNMSKGLTIRPVMTTISIIGVVITYTLCIKTLEKR